MIQGGGASTFQKATFILQDGTVVIQQPCPISRETARKLTIAEAEFLIAEADKIKDDRVENTITHNQRIYLNGVVWVDPRTIDISDLSQSANPGEPTEDDLIIPEIGLKLLPFIVPKKRRDDVIGDLTQDFCTYAAQYGRSYALKLLWWEVAELCIRRFGPIALAMGVGAWFRQKLGL